MLETIQMCGVSFLDRWRFKVEDLCNILDKNRVADVVRRGFIEMVIGHLERISVYRYSVLHAQGTRGGGGEGSGQEHQDLGQASYVRRMTCKHALRLHA